MAAMTVVTTALKVSADISMSTHTPLNSNGFSVLKRKGSLMPSRASWSASLYSLFHTFDTISLKGLFGTRYGVFSGNNTDIVGSGGLSGGSFNCAELRVRVGSGGSCGSRSMEDQDGEQFPRFHLGPSRPRGDRSRRSALCRHASLWQGIYVMEI